MNESLALSFFLLSYFVCLKFYHTIILTLIVKHRLKPCECDAACNGPLDFS